MYQTPQTNRLQQTRQSSPGRAGRAPHEVGRDLEFHQEEFVGLSPAMRRRTNNEKGKEKQKGFWGSISFLNSKHGQTSVLLMFEWFLFLPSLLVYIGDFLWCPIFEA